MTPERLKAIRERMHLPIRSLARWVGINEKSIREMELGERNIPQATRAVG
jgi:DNA-binding transcriptional regulator YiaG